LYALQAAWSALLESAQFRGVVAMKFAVQVENSLADLELLQDALARASRSQMAALAMPGVHLRAAGGL
jgi:hypothetical protein